MILIPSLSAISLAHEKGSCLGFTQQSLYQAQLPTSILHVSAANYETKLLKPLLWIVDNLIE